MGLSLRNDGNMSKYVFRENNYSLNFYNMKHTVLPLLLFLLLSVNYSFATDKDVHEKTENQDSKIETMQKNSKENLTYGKEISEEKISPLKKTMFRRFIKKNKKIKQSEDYLKVNGINALVIIGFLIFLPGLILTLLGIALIPALVMVVVGGILWIIGLLKMKNS